MSIPKCLGCKRHHCGQAAVDPSSGDFGGRKAPWHQGWGARAVPHSRPMVGGEDRNNGRRRLAEDLREKKKSSLHSNCIGHFTGAAPTRQWRRNGSMERPHTSRRPSQSKPEVSGPCYPSPSSSDAEQRDKEPIQEHQRGTSSVPEASLAAPQQSTSPGLCLGMGT